MESSSPQLDAIAHPNIKTGEAISHSITLGFFIVAVLFNLCLAAQLLTVGMAQFYTVDWWHIHVWLIRRYDGLSLILLAVVYWIPFPKRVRILTTSLPILLGLQFLTIYVHLAIPIPLAIAHPFIGFLLFSSSTTLVHHVWRILSPSIET